MRIALNSEPTLEPGFATDLGHATIAHGLLDPLVRLDANLRAVPGLAKSWDFSADGLTITFHLRGDGRWTNGDPVTARDFEFSWKRTLSPELGAANGYYLYGIAGAEAYSNCDGSDAECAGLADRVGVRAIDARTLRVRLASRRPWFAEEAARTAFLPVHRASVEKWHDAAWEPEHAVTNGPFRLTEWKHDGSLILERNDDWRGADRVAVKRVKVTIIPDPVARVRAFEADRVDGLTGLHDATGAAAREITKLRGSPAFAMYPDLGTFYFGVNIRAIRPAAQRRAMALALDREGLIARLAYVGIPATTFTPAGMPGYDVIAPRYLETRSALDEARALMASVREPKRHISLYTNDSPGLDVLARQAQAAWSRIGITTTLKVLKWEPYLRRLLKGEVDVYQLSWFSDYPDDFNFLNVFRCESPDNFTGYCVTAYDRLLHRVVATTDAKARWKVYRRLERMLTGPRGAFPILPAYWFENVNLEQPRVARSFNIASGHVDLSRVVFEEGE